MSLASLIAASCASQHPEAPGSSAASPSFTEVYPDVAPIDWDDPIDGVSAGSVTDAAGMIPFDIRVPQGFGDPVSIFTSDAGTPRDGRAIEFVYDTAERRVVIFERLPEVPVAEYDADIEATAANYGGSGVTEIHTIRGGTEALLGSFGVGTGFGMYWLEDGVEFWLGGPDLTVEQILAIAEGV